MCGISGFLQPQLEASAAIKIIKAMTDAMQSRGPDDQGYWLHEESGLVLGHRRLAIQDTSSAGHQPMLSHAKRFTMVFNGEIYNHVELRELLEQEKKINWAGHSDTETLLAGFEFWGIDATIKKSKGMFAFAVFDALKNTLTLGRDRLGEKPLYYGWQGESFVFASTLAPLKVHPDFLNKINRRSLALYFRYNNVPGEHCIFEGINKLAAGCLLTLTLFDKKISIQKYWSLIDVIRHAKAHPFLGNAEAAVRELEQHLSSAVKGQMLSDVPLGAFLSGGIDSSTIVALMQTQSQTPIHTFSIGFNSVDFDEAKEAKLVAEHLGTHHTERYVTAEEALKVVADLPAIYDEPFADSSQIPTYLLAKMTRENVVVALSGDGGDELFGGYNRYIATEKVWSKLKKFPKPLRNMLSKLMLVLSESTWDTLFKLLPFTSNWLHIGYKIHKASSVLTSNSIDELYLKLVSQWQNPDELVIADESEYDATIMDKDGLNNREVNNLNLNESEFMMAKDTSEYLADDILVKVDRAAMAVSLETRVPMLDHELLAFAWSLPSSLKINKGITKWPLKELLSSYVPKHLIDRPKAGFAIPLDEWLRGPLKEWAESLLDEHLISQQGFLQSEPIQKKWREHLSGNRNWSNQLWGVLMFQLWLASQGRIN